MKRIEDAMPREMRDQFANRIEVLEKVKALLVIPQLILATTEQVARYFDVPEKTIHSTYYRNKEELDGNGVTVMTLNDLAGRNLQNADSVRVNPGTTLFSVGDCVFEVNNRGIRLFPPRAILCMAMLLRDSAVAAEIRTQLLNLVEAAPAEVKVASAQAQEAAMLDFARAMMSGDSNGIAQAVSSLMALKDHTIAAQAASIQRLSGEKQALETMAASLTTENQDLSARNESLSASNKMLAEQASTWDEKSACNAIVRKIGSAIFGGKFSMAWLEFYRELKYQTGISVGCRGEGKNASALSSIKDEEWPAVMKTLASLAYRYCIDVVAVTNEYVVDAYKLDRIETSEGVKFNGGICRTSRVSA